MIPIPINQFIEKITSICYFDVSYDEINKVYLFNDKFAEDVDLFEFENSINKLKYELIDVLRSVNHPQVCIDDLKNIIQEIQIWFETNGLDKFENFDKLNNIMTVSKNEVVREVPPSYTLDTIFNFPEDLTGITDPFLFYLLLYKSKTEDYKNPNDFEKVKLYYVLTNYLESINSFNTFLIELTLLINRYGINFNNWELVQPILQVNQKCDFNHSKIRLAQFFRFLAKYDQIKFNLDPYKNTVVLKRFIETNFNYSIGDSKFREANNINQEFSKLDSGKKEEQIIFYKEIMEHLEEEIEYLETAYVYNPPAKKK